MRIVLFLVIALISFSSFSQKRKKVHTVILEPTDKVESLTFNVDSIIDKRLVKSNIGFAQKGLLNKRVEAVFPDEFAPYMLSVLKKTVPVKSKNQNLTLVFHELNVSEQTKSFSETGRSRVQIEFLKPIEGTLYSIGYFDSEIESNAADVTNKHDERILSSINKCLLEFQNSDWERIKGTFYDPNKKIKYDYLKVPEKGLYLTFSDMANEKKYDSFLEHTLDKKGSNLYPKYFLKDKDKKRIRKRMMAISDGKNIYIHASRYSYDSYYVKSKFIGRYIYFEDKFSDPVAAIAFGLMGAAMSNIPRSVVLDTETGLVFALNKKTIKNLLEKDYPQMFKVYEESAKTIEIQRNLIKTLNSKF